MVRPFFAFKRDKCAVRAIYVFWSMKWDGVGAEFVALVGLYICLCSEA